MSAKVEHPSVEERRAQGKKLRKKVSPSSHAGWTPAADRPDPVALLEEQNATREPDLVPVRHGRMMVSPFTFYRGAAKIMAADLEGHADGRPDVQLCGDAHLSNFGVFASPERHAAVRPERLRRDAARARSSTTSSGWPRASRSRRATTASARPRRATATLASVSGLPRGDGRVRPDAHDGHLVRPPVRGGADGRDQTARTARAPRQARRRRKRRRERSQGRRRRSPRRRARATACRRCRSSPSWSTASYRIVSQPPIVVPARELDPRPTACPPTSCSRRSTSSSAPTGPRLQDDRRHLLERFEVDRRGPQGRRRRQRRHAGVHRPAPGARPAGPAVPAGQGGDASVLEDHLPKSRYKQPGERVVQGQRMMQAASDIYLGWTKGVEAEPVLLLAPAARHEGLGRRRGDDAARARLLRPPVRMDARPRARPIGRPDRDRRVPRQERRVRPVDHRLLRALRRPERAGLPGRSPTRSAPDDSKRSKASDA